MIDLNALLDIEKLGARGEGVSRGPHGLVFTPYALPGERIRAEVDGERGKLVEVLTPSPHRVAAPCPHFTKCGGCAVQSLQNPPIRDWKGGLVADALRNAGIDAEVAPLVAAWGAGRRRVTFHSRNDQRGEPHVGFMQARSHRIFELDACPILAPEMAGALPAARRVAEILENARKTARSRRRPRALTASTSTSAAAASSTFARTGPDRGGGRDRPRAHLQSRPDPVRAPRRRKSSSAAPASTPPPGAFLQATAAGEEALAGLVLDAMGGAKKTADLFCGVGTFALRLAEKAEVFCAEGDAGALAACLRGARETPGLRPVKGEAPRSVPPPAARRRTGVFRRRRVRPPARRRRDAGAGTGEKRRPDPCRRVLQPADFCPRRKNPDWRRLCPGAGDAG